MPNLLTTVIEDPAICKTASPFTQPFPFILPPQSVSLFQPSNMATDEHTKKRKLQDDDKPRKKQKKQKKVREDESDLDMEAGLNRAFERMDGQLLADHIAQKTRRFGTELSPVELSDLYISGESHTR